MRKMNKDEAMAAAIRMEESNHRELMTTMNNMLSTLQEILLRMNSLHEFVIEVSPKEARTAIAELEEELSE
jgi:hypothetical protein